MKSFIGKLSPFPIIITLGCSQIPLFCSLPLRQFRLIEAQTWPVGKSEHDEALSGMECCQMVGDLWPTAAPPRIEAPALETTGPAEALQQPLPLLEHLKVQSSEEGCYRWFLYSSKCGLKC